MNQTIENNINEAESGLQIWIYAMTFLLLIYVLINFIFFVFGAKGQPEFSNGKYILKDKSTIVKELTKEEYDIESARVLRGFSGHWLFFYFYFSSVGYVNGYKRKK